MAQRGPSDDKGGVMDRTIGPLVLAAVALAALGCGGRERREQEGTEHVAAAGAPPVQVNWTAVEHAMGRTGAMQPGDVYKFGLPRSDLTVVVDRTQLKPALALGSWVAFKATGAGAIVMGDLVLRDDEIEPVMAKLAQDFNFDITTDFGQIEQVIQEKIGLNRAKSRVAADLSGEGVADVQREQAMEKAMADQALKDFEVQMGLVTPETAKVGETPKELGPAQTVPQTVQN